jgi:hypothetical protein
MDIASGLAWAPSGNNTEGLLEDIMELPLCPVCKEGHLLPLSDVHEPFSLWICSAPSCAYAISKDPTGDTYYKGTASFGEKDKGAKKWTEYQF